MVYLNHLFHLCSLLKKVHTMHIQSRTKSHYFIPYFHSCHLSIYTLLCTFGLTMTHSRLSVWQLYVHIYTEMHKKSPWQQWTISYGHHQLSVSATSVHAIFCKCLKFPIIHRWAFFSDMCVYICFSSSLLTSEYVLKWAPNMYEQWNI